MNKMKTAEEFKNDWLNGFELDINQINDLMIEFAKYHVEKSLEQASNLATKFLYISIDSEDEDYYKKEILNAYNLENIK